MNELTVSLVQLDLYWEKSGANLATIEEYISRLPKTDLIVLPEMFSTGFTMNAAKFAEPVGGKTFRWMRQMASQRDAAVVGSYIVKDQQQYFNRLYFVFPDGTAQHYDKKHLFSLAGENEHYTAGTERLVVKYKDWRIMPLICYDLRFPVWARSQQKDATYEYDLLLYVANWPAPRVHAWDTLLQARAIENQAFCAGVNRIGKDAAGMDYTGNTALYDFLGHQKLFSTKEETLTSKLSLAQLNSFREKYPFQSEADAFQIV